MQRVATSATQVHPVTSGAEAATTPEPSPVVTEDTFKSFVETG